MCRGREGCWDQNEHAGRRCRVQEDRSETCRGWKFAHALCTSPVASREPRIAVTASPSSPLLPPSAISVLFVPRHSDFPGGGGGGWMVGGAELLAGRPL